MIEKYFTPREAEELIPALEPLTEAIRTTKRTLDAYDSEFATLEKKIQAAGGMWVDLEPWAAKRVQRETAATHLADEIAKLQAMGVFLKDFEMGLVDFPSLMGEEEILLCWKSGESQIRFWHRPTEGYVNRKPLTADSLPSSNSPKNQVQ